MLRAARKELKPGLELRKPWMFSVRRKPISFGGEEDGTILSVYSTPMKKKRDMAKQLGIG